jgi:Cu+-exporting ATPase
MNEPENIAGNGAMETREIGVTGMTCDHCARRVEKALRGVDGVSDVRVNRPTASATVTFDNTKTKLPALEDALRKSGYPPIAR